MHRPLLYAPLPPTPSLKGRGSLFFLLDAPRTVRTTRSSRSRRRSPPVRARPRRRPRRAPRRPGRRSPAHRAASNSAPRRGGPVRLAAAPRAPRGRSASRTGTTAPPSHSSQRFTHSARTPNTWCSHPPGSPDRPRPCSNAAQSDRPVAHRAGENRVLAQRAEHLAGHVGGIADDPPIPQARPFAVGSRQADEAALRPTRRGCRRSGSPRCASCRARLGRPHTRRRAPAAPARRRTAPRRCLGPAPATPIGQGRYGISRQPSLLPTAPHASTRSSPLIEPVADLGAQCLGEACRWARAAPRRAPCAGRGYCPAHPAGTHGNCWCPSRCRSWSRPSA